MKKHERQKLAQRIFNDLMGLGVKIELDGLWIKMSPPPPIEITMETGRCQDELAELVRLQQTP